MLVIDQSHSSYRVSRAHPPHPIANEYRPPHRIACRYDPKYKDYNPEPIGLHSIHESSPHRRHERKAACAFFRFRYAMVVRVPVPFLGTQSSRDPDTFRTGGTQSSQAPGYPVDWRVSVLSAPQVP